MGRRHFEKISSNSQTGDYVKQKWMIKIGVDIAMTIVLLLLMAYQLIGEMAHEWLGIGMFALFIVHHILNRSWSKNIFKGKYTVRRIAQSILVFLILLCMIGSMVSGIIISRYVFATLSITSGSAGARSVHMLCAYWGFVFMSVHLGFHWNMILAMMQKAVLKKVQSATTIRIILRVIAAGIAIYGGIAFVKRDIWNYLTLKNHFAFFDFSEPVIFFLLDHLAVMGLFVFMGYYVGKGLSRQLFS